MGDCIIDFTAKTKLSRENGFVEADKGRPLREGPAGGWRLEIRSYRQSILLSVHQG